MKSCSALTKGGGRCQRIVSDASEYCYSHNPAMAEERHRNATRAGQAGGRGRSRGSGRSDTSGPTRALVKLEAVLVDEGSSATEELARLQAAFEELAAALLRGEVERADAVVCGQLLNYARACVRDSLSAREQEELAAQLEELEAVYGGVRGGGRGWGA
jgi:hypothetical protein